MHTLSSRRRRTGLALALLFVVGCSSEQGPTAPGGPDGPDTPTPTTPTDPPLTHTSQVGSTGGRVGLADGTAAVFPPGAVQGTTQVTVARREVSSYLDGASATGRTVIRFEAGVTSFAQDVEIRVPLPADLTPADSLHVTAGVIDDTTGAITVVHPSIQTLEGKPFVVVKTRHFSDWIFEWLGGGKRPPASAGPLEIPYYNQGESGYCWATSLQMVTRAVRHDETYTIPEIVGRMGIDEGGITSISFRLSPTIAQIVKDRTGVRPTRQTWDWVNANQMKEYLKREIGLERRPVALFATMWNHAVVVVGYDGDTFILHDPASTRTEVGYEARPWSAIGGAMGVTDNFVTLVAPVPFATTTSPVRVNVLPRAFRVSKPSTGADDPSAVYHYRWDHGRTGGYAFRHATSDEGVETLPGGVRTLSVDGDVQLSNASRSEPAEVSVWMDVTAMGAPTGVGHVSIQRTVTVGPNAVASFRPGDLPVDTFRYNRATPTEYLVSVSALVGATRVDRTSFRFSIDPVVPALTSLDPATAMVGETVRIRGRHLGWSRYRNRVTIGGVEVKDFVAWTNDQITVKVPSGAASGDVVVTRGEVASNPLPFSLKDLVTEQAFELTWGNRANSLLVTAAIDVRAVSGGWKSVFTERSSFTPEEWVKLYFGTQSPGAGGANQYEITVTPQAAVTGLMAGEVTFLRARWVVRSQTPNGLPVTEVTGDPLLLDEAFSPYSKQADLHLLYRVVSPNLRDTLMIEKDGFYLSFSPGHVGMRAPEPGGWSKDR